jgi:hypothetical protein
VVEVVAITLEPLDITLVRVEVVVEQAGQHNLQILLVELLEMDPWVKGLMVG